MRLRSSLPHLLWLAVGIPTAAATAQNLATPVPNPSGSVLLMVDVRDASVALLTAVPKSEAWRAPPPTRGARLVVAMRSVSGRVLQTFDVPLPTKHGTCHPHAGPEPEDPNDDRFVLPVRVPDLGVALAQIDFDRDVDGQRSRLGSIAASALQAVQPAGGVTVRTVRNSGPTSNRFDLVILGDGYLATQQAQFDTDVQDLVNHLFSTTQPVEPYRTYRNYFNVHSVFRTSAFSVLNNAPGSRLSAYGAVVVAPAFVNPLELGGFNQAMIDAAQAPDVQTGGVLILLNTPNNYGGIASPNQYGMGTTNRVAVSGQNPKFKFPQLMEHELGHAFANLEDEYPTIGGGTDSPANPEHPEANVTNRPGAPSAKWFYWADRLSPPGAFMGGARFEFGVWHPDAACMMNLLENTLCVVCQEEIVKRIYTVGGITALSNPSPAATQFSMGDLEVRTLSFVDTTPNGDGSYEWRIDGVPQTNPPPSQSMTISGLLLGVGQHVVEARLRDRSTRVAGQTTTAFVRRDPNDALLSRWTWTVDVAPPPESRRLFYQSGSSGTYPGHLGTQAAAVGDVDLDGVPDFAFVAPSEVTLVSGATFAVITSRSNLGGDLNTGTPFVAGIGRVNGDAVPDVVIGLPRSNGVIGANANIVMVCSGSDLSEIYRLTPTGQLSANTAYGGQIVDLGRIDGDTVDDFAVTFAGSVPMVKVYSGSNGGVIRTHTFAASSTGAVAIAAMADINNDGKRELVIASQRNGASDVEVKSGANGATLASFISPAGEVYTAVTTVDTDNDGKPEVVLGAPLLASSRGRVRTLAIDLATNTLSSLRVVDGAAANDFYGFAVAPAGDYDMDGTTDIVVGAPGLAATAGSNGSFGRIEILSGATGAVVESRPDGVYPGGLYGYAVGNVGDIDDDGLEDIVVCAPRFGPRIGGSPTNLGAIRIYSPAEKMLTGAPATIATGAGGTHTLNLDLGPARAGESYLVLGSVTGTIPGRMVLTRRIPLIDDFYFSATLNTPNVGLFVNTAGVLDSQGRATAAILVPPGVLVGLEGIKAYHAALTLGPGVVTATTNAVPFRLVR